MPTVLSAVLAVLLLLALVAVALTAVALRRTRSAAAAHELSLRQELTRLQATRAELERTSYTDPLTGVWNYRYLQLALDREIARCARHTHPEGADRLALLLLEIEGFDEIRREHGHQRGGAVLRDLVQRLAMEVREADVFGRYGGEEFLVLLPDTDAAGAEHVAERLRWTVRRHPLALPSVSAPVLLPALGGEAEEGGADAAPVNGLSATVGIAVLPRDGGHAALLLRAADRALAAARQPAPNGAESTVRTPDRPTGRSTADQANALLATPSEAEDPPPEPVYSLLAQGCELTVNADGWA